MPRFDGKQVLIIGASGGLGTAFAREFAREGVTVYLAGRNPATLELLENEINAAGILALDLENADSIRTMLETIETTIPNLSVVINATGYDVRKPFEAHTLAEIDRSLSVNLRGSILITQALLPLLKRNQGIIVHMGGFADGRLAFPYYPADVASRAGLRSFIDSVNREIAGSGTVVSYFSPSPADTESERPFHLLWQQMGMKIVTTEAVARALLNAVTRRKKVAIMGGWLTVTFARLNAAFPGLADLIAMNGYTQQLRVFFEDAPPAVIQPKPKAQQTLGIILIVASFVLYGVGLLLIPFVTLDTGAKAVVVGSSLALGELTFWIGAALAGSAVVNRYRKWLNPRNWCRDAE